MPEFFKNLSLLLNRHEKELSNHSLLECSTIKTIKTDRIIFLQAEKNVNVHGSKNLEPLALLDTDACASSKWPYIKLLQLQLPNFGNL